MTPWQCVREPAIVSPAAVTAHATVQIEGPKHSALPGYGSPRPTRLYLASLALAKYDRRGCAQSVLDFSNSVGVAHKIDNDVAWRLCID